MWIKRMATIKIIVERPEEVKVCWKLYLRNDIPEKAQNSSFSHYLCDKYFYLLKLPTVRTKKLALYITKHGLPWWLRW